MKLEFNRTQLLALMQDFYTMSGIRIVLFDDEYRELLSYPAHHCGFCTQMKAHAPTRSLCAASDAYSFRESALTGKPVIYRCHAGLIEVTTPLVINHMTIGYLMFGQIADLDAESALDSMLSGKLRQYGLEPGADITRDIPVKSSQQIHAAAKIMEACTLYAVLNQAVSLRAGHFSEQLRTYLLSHLHEQHSSHSIAKEMGISRSRLYMQCQESFGMGVSQYLCALRMEQAQKLLRSTAMSVTQISNAVGFSDYNYFCRVFRNKTGFTPKVYRTNFHSGKKSIDKDT